MYADSLQKKKEHTWISYFLTYTISFEVYITQHKGVGSTRREIYWSWYTMSLFTYIEHVIIISMI